MGLELGMVLTDVAVLGAVAASVAYFAKNRSNEDSGGAMTAPPASDETTKVVTLSEQQAPPTDPSNEGVLGLVPSKRTEPLATGFARRPPKLADSTALSELSEPLPDGTARLKEELWWAVCELGDLGTVTTAIFDSSGALVRGEGSLMRSGEAGKMVSCGLAAEVVYDDASGFPFLDALRCQSVAAFPLLQRGGTLVVASEEPDFFGNQELRVTKAVASRLGAFMPLFDGHLELEGVGDR